MTKLLFSKKTLAFLLCALLYGIAALALFTSGITHYERLHLVLDVGGALLSLLLALFLWNRLRAVRLQERGYLTLCFGFAAAADLLHTVVGIEWTGSLAMVTTHSYYLRPVTWPPSGYLLPIGLMWSLWLMRHQVTLRKRIFAIGMGAVMLALLALSLALPSRVDTGILGISRPNLIPLLLLWAVVIYDCWRERHRYPLCGDLALMGVFLWVANLFMLYSAVPHDNFSMMAHIGKLTAYALLLINLMVVAANDERARIEAEKALSLSEQHLKLAVASGQIGIWEYHLQTKELIWDDAMFALYGVRREDFSGTYDAWSTRLHPEDRAATEAALQDAINGVREYEPDFRIIWPDGEVHYIKGHAQVIKDQAGNPVCMIGTNWDNRAHAKTQQQLQLAYAAINVSKSAFFWLSPEGQVMDVSDYACQSLGYSREELMGMHLWDFDPDFPREAWSIEWGRLKQTKLANLETRHQRKDGVIFPVEVTASYIVFDGKEYSFAFVKDIAERKRVEEALRQSEERLRQAIRVADIGMFDHDHRANTIYWSPEQRKIYGWGPDEPVTLQAMLARVYPEDLKRVEQAIRHAHYPAGNGEFEIEHRIVHPDGEVRWVLIRSNTFFEGEGGAR